MTPEQLVPEIVKALREISPWSWKDQFKGENPYGVLIASSPLWLAQIVVGVVAERARTHFYVKGYGPTPDASFKKWNECINIALRDFGLTEADWQWLKEKAGE